MITSKPATMTTRNMLLVVSWRRLSLRMARGSHHWVHRVVCRLMWKPRAQLRPSLVSHSWLSHDHAFAIGFLFSLLPRAATLALLAFAGEILRGHSGAELLPLPRTSYRSIPLGERT